MESVSGMMNYPVETHELGKRYGTVTAVDQLSLRVGQGEIYAFLGLNGAGKTTTMRMLLGMIRPTSGTATVLGLPVRRANSHPWQRIGYLVETPRAYPELTVAENLEVQRRLHPGTKPDAIDRVIERLALAPYRERRAGTLSQGNAQRLGLAKALLHSPELLILDEPANGLDPAGIVDIRELLLELTQQQGVTVLISSHILAEVTRLAQRIGIIHQGHLLQEMSIDELTYNRRKRLILKTRDNQAACATLLSAGHEVLNTHNGKLELNGLAAITSPDQIATLLVQAGIPLLELMVEEEDLEHYFLRLIGLDTASNAGATAVANGRKRYA